MRKETAMPYLPGKFVWFECVTRDARKAQAFYGEVLGWKVQAFPMGDFTYEMIDAGGTTIGGYAAPSDPKTRPHWISVLSVDDVDATAKKVTAAGGKVLDPPADMPTVGRLATVADPEGATFKIYRATDGDTPDTPWSQGQFYWNELYVSDAKKAVAFYEKVFGYTDKPMDMGPVGIYHVLASSGADRAGVFTAPPGVAAAWVPYVAVDDCDATVARARKLGATIQQEPSDIPGIGRWAMFADTTGATLAVINPAAK